MDFLEKYEEEKKEEKKVRTYSFTCSSKNKETEKLIMDYVEKLEKKNIPYGRFMKKILVDYIKGVDSKDKGEFLCESKNGYNVVEIENSIRNVFNESYSNSLLKFDSIMNQLKEQKDLIRELTSTIEKQNEIIESLVKAGFSAGNNEHLVDIIEEKENNSSIADKSLDEDAMKIADSLPDSLDI